MAFTGSSAYFCEWLHHGKIKQLKITCTKFFTTAILLLLVVPAFAGASAEEKARNSSEQWLALVDAGKFIGSWETSAKYFKTTISPKQWELSLDAIRWTLGDLVSRKLKSVKYARSLPDVPDGGYMVLQFETSFVNKKVAFETVTPKLDDHGKWRVCGYYIHL